MREIRLNITLRGQTAELLNVLIEQGNKPKEVIYDALSVFDFAIQEIAEGKIFGSVDTDSETVNTVTTPILQQVRKHPVWLEKYLNTYASEKVEVAEET